MATLTKVPPKPEPVVYNLTLSEDEVAILREWANFSELVDETGKNLGHFLWIALGDTPQRYVPRGTSDFKDNKLTLVRKQGM